MEESYRVTPTMTLGRVRTASDSTGGKAAGVDSRRLRAASAPSTPRVASMEARSRNVKWSKDGPKTGESSSSWQVPKCGACVHIATDSVLPTSTRDRRAIVRLICLPAEEAGVCRSH